MTDAAVILDQVSRTYGSVRAVDGVTLDIRKGEFFTLLGSSGSGKTTSLRLIAGFEQPDSGRVLIDGRDVTRLPAHRRNVHTVFQDYALFPHMTAGENIAFALDLKGASSADKRKAVAEALELVQLKGFENRRPSEMSGGQQQRIALARAIVDHPSVLLLDEPLSALDAKIRHELREELKRLQRETRISFVYVTHDQEEALTLSDRLAVMQSGRVRQLGTPMDVYEHPTDLFVAAFVGKANFLDGRLVAVDGTRARVQVGSIACEGTMAGPASPGATVRLMVRPENLALAAANAVGIAGTVTQAQYQGFATQYLVRCGAQLFHVLELRRRGAEPRGEGSSVSLTWKWDEALVYPVS